MTRQFLTLSLGLGAMLLATQHAFAQSNRCAPREVVVAQLSEKYGETQRSICLGSNDALVEMFASVNTGTWTITVTLPGGQTCIVAAGSAFEALAEAPATTGSDA